MNIKFICWKGKQKRIIESTGIDLFSGNYEEYVSKAKLKQCWHWIGYIHLVQGSLEIFVLNIIYILTKMMHYTL